MDKKKENQYYNIRMEEDMKGNLKIIYQMDKEYLFIQMV
tara:strand:- start:31 stop:147 length:117 start_codon:yes stop_codon:yes gene_type:complete